MIYAENILIFLVAPLVIGFFLLKGETKRFIGFFITGTIICLLSSYINSFIASISGIPAAEAVIRLTPILEEVMKTLPLLFYVVVFAPRNEDIWKSAIALGLGFATFENCCFVVGSGAESLSYVLIRGFAAGIMHTLCSAGVGWALTMVNTRRYFFGYGVFASVCICTAFHSVYNLMVSTDDAWKTAGYFMPIVTAIFVILLSNFISIKKQLKE